jgi:oxygen-independent coproporphyrinogen III oxidase
MIFGNKGWITEFGMRGEGESHQSLPSPPYGVRKEYVKKDPEYVRWYPPGLEPLSGEDIWQDPGAEYGTDPIAVYIHVPFCVSLCDYCPFTRYEWQAETVSLYLQALLQEIALVSQIAKLHHRPVAAGYLGGGTPTSLETKQLELILAQCLQSFSMAPAAEMSIEANPDTVNRQKLQEIHSLGFNRISFGVQSFVDPLLKLIGRRHKAKQSRQSIEAARQAGFENICLDLIYKLPGQSPELWEEDLQQAIDLGVHHISTYCLYIPPKTVMHREMQAGRLIPQPDEEQELKMVELTAEILSNAGYQQLTVYDFALPGKGCLHHAMNWKAPQGEYWGLGPGAFSHNSGYIYCNRSDVRGYADILNRGKLPTALGKKISRSEQMARFMILGLKYMSVDKQKFRKRFGKDVDRVFAGALHQLVEWGLIENGREKVSLTERGTYYVTNVCKAFYSEESKRQPQPRAPRGS